MLEPGDVVYIYTAHISRPGHKFYVVCCTEPVVLGFLINSKISRYIRNRPVLMESQLVVEQASHPFLRYDSHLDCSETHTFDLEYLERCVRVSAAHRGCIAPDLAQSVISVVNESRTIPDLQQARIVEALRRRFGRA